MILARPGAAFAFSHPAHAIALGFGAGLAPWAPGTFGTLAGWALALAIGWLAPAAMLAAAAAAFVVGLWACELTGRRLGVADHGSVVWDEVAAFLLILAIVPAQLGWQAAAFAAFRFFDIVKPPPIRQFERRWKNGFGVMFDDLLAAGYALLVLALVKRIFL
jgi:phosphatidylglycerophosphatase A